MKARKWLCFVTAVVMLLGVATLVTGCSDSDTVQVTWYNGRTVLKTEDVKSGDKVKEWTPTREGHVFTGWFSDQTCDTPFDFDKPITENTSIFSSWRSAVVQEDTRKWFAIGTGAETLKASNWKTALNAAKNEAGDVTLDGNGYATFTVKEGYESLVFSKAADSNTFTLTLTLRPGDQFQIAASMIDDSTWTGDAGFARMGLGNLPGFAFADNGTVTAADKTYGEVKNAEGEVVFKGTKGLDADPTMWNIVLADGKDGKYEFTITTFPGDDKNNTLTWKLKEELPPLAETHKMYLVGTIGEDPSTWFDPADDAEKIFLNKGSDGKTWSTLLTVTEANYPTWGGEKKDFAAIKVKNAISGKDFGVDGGADNIQLTPGSWYITYNSETDKVAYVKADFYLVGTFEGANFSVKEGTTPKLTTTDSLTYTVTFTVTDVSGTNDYKWLAEQNKGIFAIKVAAYAGDAGIVNTYTADGGDNWYMSEAGQYTVTIAVKTGTVTVAKK